jgi:hypothetical protein
MLFKANALKNFRLDARDGEIGRVMDFYFDDKHWAVRYLVADTGTWLTGRAVLISPHSLVSVGMQVKHVTVALTKKQIEDSPSLAHDMPVSRQFEQSYYGYYGWPTYWGGEHMWGAQPYLVGAGRKWAENADPGKAWDPHLRSAREVDGYKIEATDGPIGNVVDFVIDDVTWAIRYLIVDTGKWLPGKKVLVSPHWIGKVSWPDSQVMVKMSRDAVQKSPEYSDDSLLTRDYEDRLHRHYKHEGYWVNDTTEGGQHAMKAVKAGAPGLARRGGKFLSR